MLSPWKAGAVAGLENDRSPSYEAVGEIDTWAVGGIVSIFGEDHCGRGWRTLENTCIFIYRWLTTPDSE